MFSVQCEELRVDHLTRLLVARMPYTCWFFLNQQAYDIFIFNLGLHFGREVYFEARECWRTVHGMKEGDPLEDDEE